MTNKVKIKEIFKSIQGEGAYIGYEQVFVRFCRCNLSCKYCDTDFLSKSENDAKIYSPQDLANIINSYKVHSVSLTGGEPLLEIEFLKEFLPICNLPIYLETNATLPQNLMQIIDYISYVSADIKLATSTGMKNLFEIHDEFFEIAKGKNLFAKVVFDENITSEEILKTCRLCEKYGIELILQPKMDGEILKLEKKCIENIFLEFVKLYSRTRLIPQMHKFLNLR